MKPSTSTIVRVSLLAIALANMLLMSLGITPKELDAWPEAYRIGSTVVTVVLAVINSWKNNSFTEEAIKADEYLAELRSEKDQS